MRIDPGSFLPAAAVAGAISAAMAEGRPFALIRLGDGEALTLAQGTVLTPAQVAARGFLRQAGVIVPDFRARDRVVEAVRRADLVGLADRRDLPDFAPLTERVLDFHGLRPERICHCCINYALQDEGRLIPLLADKRLFVVNRRWREWAAALVELYGLNVRGGASIDHFGQAQAVLSAAKKNRFDTALVAAGVPATWLCVKLAALCRCVALDLGRLADLMIDLRQHHGG